MSNGMMQNDGVGLREPNGERARLAILSSSPALALHVITAKATAIRTLERVSLIQDTRGSMQEMPRTECGTGHYFIYTCSRIITRRR